MTNAEALRRLKDKRDKLFNRLGKVAIVEALDKAISDLSTEPKAGHWIKYSIPRCGEQHYACTLCGYYINFGQWGELYTKEFKYCPNCGAKMLPTDSNCDSCEHQNEVDGSNCYECVKGIRNNYRADSEKE